MSEVMDVDCGRVFEPQKPFEGGRVNVVQVGLGTNATFIQNIAGSRDEWDKEIGWMMEVVSVDRSDIISGVGVEPVKEHLETLHQSCCGYLPGVGLAQVALGEEDAKQLPIHVLPQRTHDFLLKQVPVARREDLRDHLAFLMNMSCVGTTHPELEAQRDWIQQRYNLKLNLEWRETEVWSWRKLCREFDFVGCELLIVDTEGHDAKVLRSMMSHCQEAQTVHGRKVWPDVIQFETMSHCDKVEGTGAEWAAIQALERNGYTLVHYSHHNSHLAFTEAIQNENRVRKWVETITCDTCGSRGSFPYSSDIQGIYCNKCITNTR